MTIIWYTFISERSWRNVRRELEHDGFTLPFRDGVVHNKNTGYRLLSGYDPNTNVLKFTITYPLEIDTRVLRKTLDKLIGVEGKIRTK